MDVSDVLSDSVIARFWRHVDRREPEACWPWMSGRDKPRYVMSVGKRRDGNIGVARVSWLIHRGTLSSDLIVCHHCDNPRCVNPNHLFLGTHKDNAEDRNRKNRQVKGERQHSAKLTADLVRQARQRRSQGEYIHVLAQAFGVTKNAMRQLLLRRTWKHVE